MSDALFMAILAGFAVLTWALILLCDWLLGGGQ
jgi:hypothetical protein